MNKRVLYRKVDAEFEGISKLVMVSRMSRIKLILFSVTFALSLIPISFLFFFVISQLDAVVIFVISFMFLGLFSLFGMLTVEERFVFDRSSRNYIYTRRRLTSYLTRKGEEKTYPMAEIDVKWGPGFQHYPSSLVVQTSKVEYQFAFMAEGPTLYELEDRIQTFLGMQTEPQPEPVAQTPETPTPAAPAEISQPKLAKMEVRPEILLYANMQKELNSWGRSSLVLGGIHLLSFGLLAPSWGVVLLLVGAGAYLFRHSALFVVFAAVLAWVGVNNAVFSELGIWTLFGLYQVYLSYKVFTKYQLFTTAEQFTMQRESAEGTTDQKQYLRTRRFFPAIGCGLSAVAVLGMIVFIAAGAIYYVAQGEVYEAQWPDLVLDAFFGLATLGFSVSLAVLIARLQHRWMGWLGALGGGLLLAAMYWVYLTA